MNYIILFATGLINKVEIKTVRIFLSSFIGSIYAVLSFSQILENSLGLSIKILLSIAMVYIAFKPKMPKIFLKQLLIFYLASFTFGGVAFAMLYFIKPSEILMKNGIYVGTYPIKIALLGGTLGFIIITIAFKSIKSKISKKDIYYTIEISIQNKVLVTKAMLDTGNLLKDPITGLPVIVIEKDQLLKILPKEIIENVENIIKGKFKYSEDTKKYICNFRMIPYSSVGDNNGLMLGVTTDYTKIIDEENAIVKNAIVGIYNGILSKKYHALISLEMITKQGGDKSEYIRNA